MEDKRRKPKFRRTDFRKYSKLGVRRKKLQKYRKAKGGDNKIRLNKKGHVKNVRVGFKNNKTKRGLVKNLKPVRVFNLKDLKNLKQGEIAIIAKIGTKNKIEIAKYSLEKEIVLVNLNSKKFLEKIEVKLKKIEEDKISRTKKKKVRERKIEEEKENIGEKVEKKEDEEINQDKKLGQVSEKLIAENSNKKEIQTNNYGRGK